MSLKLIDNTTFNRDTSDRLEQAFKRESRRVARERLRAARAAFRSVYTIENDRNRFHVGQSLSNPNFISLFIGVAPVNPQRIQGYVTGESRTTRLGGRQFKRIFAQGDRTYQRRTRRSYPLRLYYKPIASRVTPAVRRALAQLDEQYSSAILRVLQERIK